MVYYFRKIYDIISYLISSHLILPYLILSYPEYISLWITAFFVLQEQRNKIFVDFVKVGGDIQELVVNFQASLEESQQSRVQWGFRPEKWLCDRHGDKKAAKLKARKEQLGLSFGCTHFFPQPLQKIIGIVHDVASMLGLRTAGVSKTRSCPMTQRKSSISP